MAASLLLAAPANADPGAAQSSSPDLRSNLTLGGFHGPLRVAAAHAPAPLSIGTGLAFEVLSKDDMIVRGDSNTRVAGTLGFSVVPDENLELFLTLTSRANRNSTSVPELIQALGEASFGAKGFTGVSPGVSLGALGSVHLLNEQGELGWKGDATTVRVAALASIDGRAIDDEASVRAHFNLGYTLQNGHNLPGGRTLTAVEQFGGGITEFDTIDLGVALEAFPEGVTPFLEYMVQVPVGTRIDTSEVCVEGQPCPADEGFSSFPQRVSLGVAGQVVPGLSLRGAVDIGLQSTIVTGLPATPPYNVILGLAYDLGAPTAAPAALSVAPPAPAEAPLGRIRGRVVDAATRQPLSGARVSYAKTGKTDQVVGDDGIFVSYGLKPGTVRIEVSNPGYNDRAFQIPVGEGTVNFSFPLKPADGIPGAPPGSQRPGKSSKKKKKVKRKAAPSPPPPPPAAPESFDPLAP